MSENIGPKLTFLGYWQLKFFSSHHMKKCGHQNVSIKFFICSETQTQIFGHQMENSRSGGQFFKNQNKLRMNALQAAMVIIPANKC